MQRCVNVQAIFEKTTAVPSWTSEIERITLMQLACEVPDDGLIVEIGALYGGMTAVLGLSQPRARIIAIDNFSWSPMDSMKASKKTLLDNVASCGVSNVVVMEGDSREIARIWDQPIDLLWIDGGHSYEFVRADLENFGPHAKVIALHDWDNAFWPSIRQAVEDFIRHHPEWHVERSAEMVVVLLPLHPNPVGHSFENTSEA